MHGEIYVQHLDTLYRWNGGKPCPKASLFRYLELLGILKKGEIQLMQEVRPVLYPASGSFYYLR